MDPNTRAIQKLFEADRALIDILRELIERVQSLERLVEAQPAEGLEKLESPPDITPEMLAAGHDAISSNWVDFISDDGSHLMEPTLRQVFLAMMAARPQSQP